MGRKGQCDGTCKGATVNNPKRKEIVFTRVELEAMPDNRLKELSKHGAEYERMHAQTILIERSVGVTVNHGHAPPKIQPVKTLAKPRGEAYRNKQKGKAHYGKRFA